MPKTNFSNSDELNKENNKIVECDEYLNFHLFNIYSMDTMSTLFQKAINDYSFGYSTELTGNLIKWNIHIGDDYNKKNIIYVTIDHKLVASSLFNNDDIVILTTFGILIYTFNENNKSSDNDKHIFLNYFYSMELTFNRKKDMKILQYYKKMFSKSTLPSPNYDSFRSLDGWISDVKNNKLILLKYGVELLKFAIIEHKLELIDDIYKK
ncbi:hypothetical protein RhiirA5_443790, partial [Rhizophagus irregularis]